MLRGEIGESVDCFKKGSEMIGFAFRKYDFDFHVENRINLGKAGGGKTTLNTVAVVKVRDDYSPYEGRRNKIEQKPISAIFKRTNKRKQIIEWIWGLWEEFEMTQVIILTTT